MKVTAIVVATAMSALASPAVAQTVVGSLER